MINEILQTQGQLPTVVLIVLLIAAFVIAFKVMKMVFQTVLVSFISGVFYLALSVLMFDSVPSVNDTLLFAFLGSTFYMGYSFLMSAYSITAKLVEIPYRLIKLGLKPFTWLFGEIKKSWKLKRLRKKLEKGSTDFSPSDNGEKSTKDVVLDKVREKDED